MRIGFDFRPALKKNSRRRGIGRYTYELAKELLKVESEHEFVFYAIPGEILSLAGDFELRRTAYLDYPSRLNWILDIALFPRYLRKDDLHLFHCAELTSIPRSGSTQVWITVHDLIPYIYWNETVKRVPRDFAYSLKLAFKRAREADRVITDSEHSKRDICERMEIPAEKVEVVYLGSSDDLGPVDRELALRVLKDRYKIEDPFLLYVGGSDYRKNLNLLINAFALIRGRGYSGKLVIAGETFLLDIPEVRELRETVQSLGLGSQVSFVGYVPDEDLSRFYSACDFFVFPSLYEGFGLPVLEAMKCGAPLLLSRTSSLPEVAGDCAHYFDPMEVEDLVTVFWNASGDPHTVETLRFRGLERANRFTWRAAAERIHGLYNQCEV